MGFYNVVKPCVVAKRHHVRPTAAPIEVDDVTAAPLVESGCMEAYPRQVVSDEQAAAAEAGVEVANRIIESLSEAADPADDEQPTDPPRRPRGGRRRTEG